ncbi:MAG: hypothetical protein HQK49_16320 [Oligoflexia bacterium]|nr:hypothetical protein [Oligoflexia bacterium]
MNKLKLFFFVIAICCIFFAPSIIRGKAPLINLVDKSSLFYSFSYNADLYHAQMLPSYKSGEFAFNKIKWDFTNGFGSSTRGGSTPSIMPFNPLGIFHYWVVKNFSIGIFSVGGWISFLLLVFCLYFTGIVAFKLGFNFIEASSVALLTLCGTTIVNHASFPNYMGGVAFLPISIFLLLKTITEEKTKIYTIILLPLFLALPAYICMINVYVNFMLLIVIFAFLFFMSENDRCKKIYMYKYKIIFVFALYCFFISPSLTSYVYYLIHYPLPSYAVARNDPSVINPISYVFATLFSVFKTNSPFVNLFYDVGFINLDDYQFMDFLSKKIREGSILVPFIGLSSIGFIVGIIKSSGKLKSIALIYLFLFCYGLIQNFNLLPHRLGDFKIIKCQMILLSPLFSILSVYGLKNIFHARSNRFVRISLSLVSVLMLSLLLIYKILAFMAKSSISGHLSPNGQAILSKFISSKYVAQYYFPLSDYRMGTPYTHWSIDTTYIGLFCLCVFFLIYSKKIELNKFIIFAAFLPGVYNWFIFGGYQYKNEINADEYYRNENAELFVKQKLSDYENLYRADYIGVINPLKNEKRFIRTGLLLDMPTLSGGGFFNNIDVWKVKNKLFSPYPNAYNLFYIPNNDNIEIYSKLFCLKFIISDIDHSEWNNLYRNYAYSDYWKKVYEFSRVRRLIQVSKKNSIAEDLNFFLNNYKSMNINEDTSYITKENMAKFGINWKNNDAVITNIKHAKNIIQFQINAKRPSLVEINYVLDTNWKVIVDNQESFLIPINYIFNAVKVSSGKHEIVLEFKGNLI